MEYLEHSQMADHINRKSCSILRINADKEVNSNVRLNSGENRKKGRKRNNNATASKPTYEAYGALQFCYDYFNQALFCSKLPDVLITLTRKRGALGYFAHSRFEKNNKVISHEISLNPQYTKLLGDRETLSTLVHEMVHLWRYEFGSLNKRGGKGAGGYHDVIWADKMDELGLPPINVGCGKGTRTGYRVINGIKDGGLFDQACMTLFAEGFRIDWHEVSPNAHAGQGSASDVSDGGSTGSKRKKDKVKFTCLNKSCKLNAWAKASAKLICGHCELPMMSELATTAKKEPQTSEGNASLPVISMRCRSNSNEGKNQPKNISATPQKGA